MKNFLRVTVLAICAIFMVANVSAQVITAERASEIANQFFANGKQKSAAFRSTSATLTQSVDSHAITGESNEAPTFHILTGADGKGFVIVSGEETENPIIGYSIDGTIDTNNLPDGFAGYMSDIDAQVRALREYNAANPQKAAARSAMQKAADYEYNATSMGNIVKNLNTAPWGQHGPFNNLCKTTDGQTALTGCGPTAFAILCYYYKWPASGVGTVTHQGTGENMELGHTYDYASMRNDDYSSGYTEAEANAVAVLMRDLGWANQVGYGTGSTSFSETGQHMVDHFRFKSERPVDHGASLAVVRSTLGNDTQWKTYIKNCLDAGYPIPYASTTNTSNSARHIYILDGYTDNDYYHFNWGWSGQGNGWFTLDNMVPDDYSNYSNSHKAYFNLIPDATTYTVTATVNDSNMGTVSINGGTAGSTVTADLLQGVTATLTAHPADGYALASWTKGGVIVGTRNTLQVPVGTSGNDYVANFDNEENVIVEKDCTFKISDVATSGVSGSYCSTWTTSDGIVLSCSKGSEPAYALSTTVNTFFAKAPVGNSETLVSDITYTLTAPAGYIIKSYSFKGKSPSSSYTIDVTVGGNTTNVTNASAGVMISASDINSQSTSFILGSTYAGRAGLAILEDGVTVTIQSEGGASTPTTYAVTTTANPAAGGTAKFAVGTGSQKTQGDVENGTEITLYATANTGYNFVNWTLGGNVVSTDATCNVNVAQASNYVANFEPEAAEPELPITGTEVNATFAGATGFVNQGKTNQVVLPATQTDPAITFSANDAKIGYSTVDGIKYPYLFKGTDFTISVPAPYKIAGYKLTVQGHNFNEGTFTYTVGTQNAAAAMRTAASARSNAATATISGTTPLSVMATGLNTSEINIGVGSASAETAGIIVKELQLDLVQESQEPVEVSGDLEFTFVRNGSDVTVAVSGADGVTATITATSPNSDGTTAKTDPWNTGGAMANRTDVLCTSTNTKNATENSPITYTLTVNRLRAKVTDVAFTHVAVNSGGNLQPSDGTIRHCNFKLEANGNAVGTVLNDQNIWIPGGSTDKTIEFNNLSVAADGTLTIKLTIYKGTSNDGCYYGLKKITLTAAEPETDPLAGKYFRLKEKSTGTYMNIYDNSTHGKETRGGVNVTTKNESNDGQIFQFIESGTNYMLLSKTGYYITWAEWNVNADSKENGADLTFEPTAAELEYFISCTKGYFKIDDDKGTPSLGKFVYSDGAQSAAATWVLEEVVYYTVTATAGEGGSVSPLTSTIEKGKPVTLTATANEGYHFVNWTKDDVEVSTKATDTFTATANGEYVANFAINTYAITATANPGTGGSASVSAATVEHGASVTLTATPSAGYYFVNWTKDTEYVSCENPYTINSVTADAEYIANFEEIVANVTLTDIQGNTYNVTLNGLTGEVNAETLEAKLKAEYPFIEEFGINPTFADNGTSYTYTNSVKLMFKVSKTTDDPKTDNLWHNIYYPTNANGRPNYLSASTAETTLVEKVNDGTYNYGANPTYNTMGGNPKIAWAIYNVNNSFEFIFKNELTGKYIKVTSIASSDAQNVEFVEKAEATAFTFLGDAGTYNGDYALVAKVGEETGYLCSSSSSYGYATHHNSNTHQGAWMKIQEADYTDFIRALDERLLRFDIGNDKYLITNEFQIMIDSLVYNKEQIRLNQFNTYFDAIDKAVKTWPKISLTITPENKGTTNIGGEENVVRKYVPTGDLTIEAVPVEGYHFVKWIDGTNEVETAAYTKNISGGKDDVIALTAEFAINIYNINVTAGEGGSASASAANVEHGSEVTLTAVANDGYEFVNWTKGTDVVSTDATYTFTATVDGEYVANFRQIANCIVTVTATTIGGENGGTVKVAVGTTESNESLVVNKDANVTFTATTAGTNYRFAGWYNENDECVSTDASYSTTITANTTYNAKFIKQVDVRIELIKNGYAFAYIGDEATLTHKVFDYGTTVDIHAVSYSADAIFAYWTLDGTKLSQDADYSFVAEEDSYYFVANFNYKAYIAVVAGDNGTAYIGSEGVTTFEMATGNTVTITAKAKSGYVFDRWALIDGSGDEGTTVSTSAVYTLTLNANPNTTVTYKAFFRQITALEDGKAYRIAGKMSDGTLRYIYRDGQNLKWSTTKDETAKSIFIAQSDFNGSLNLISAVGDYGWNYDGDLSHSYATLKTADGYKTGTFTLYAVSGNNKRSYNAYGTSNSNDLNFNTGENIRKENENGNCTDMVFEEVPFAFQVSVADGSNAKLGTVNLPFATTVPAGVTAYGVDHTEGEQVYMAELELTNNVLPAKTPVLVEAEKAGKFGFAPAPASAAVHKTGFAGTLEAEDIPGTTDAYILSYKGVGTRIMLYKLSSTDRTINANKAYFIEATGKASALQFVFGETTDIEEVEREDLEHTIYDLQGRKLSEITEPGIYIIDGKKVWIK